MKLQKLSEGIIFGTPEPKRGCLSSYMPWFCQLDDGSLLVSAAIGDYFDAPNAKTHLFRSTDCCRSFVPMGSPFDYSSEAYPAYGLMKLANIGNGHLAAIGYGFIWNKGSAGPANTETNGLLDCPIFFSESYDNGATFTPCRRIDCRWGAHAEASAPITVLENGSYITPIAAMQDWEGKFASPMCGRLLRSDDAGRTWNDSTVTMDFGADVSVWEQRLAVTESGKLVDIAWVENLKTGELHNNHAAVSSDGGKSFSKPIDTGIRGQTSSVCAVGGERILALHSMRRHVDRYGILACIVSISDGKWDIESSEYIWEPHFDMTASKGNLEVFSMLRFGQPSAVLLRDGTVLCTHWFMENEVCRTVWQRFRLAGDAQ